jgi:hypothetical protein
MNVVDVHNGCAHNVCRQEQDTGDVTRVTLAPGECRSACLSPAIDLGVSVQCAGAATPKHVSHRTRLVPSHASWPPLPSFRAVAPMVTQTAGFNRVCPTPEASGGVLPPIRPRASLCLLVIVLYTVLALCGPVVLCTRSHTGAERLCVHPRPSSIVCVLQLCKCCMFPLLPLRPALLLPAAVDV